MNVTKRNVVKAVINNAFLAAILIATVMLLINLANKKNNGIIILNEYSHAVVVCGEGLTVNEGHYGDPEIDQLIDLAELKCSLLEEGE